MTYHFTVDIYAAAAAGTTNGKAHGTYDVTIADGVNTVTVNVSRFRSTGYSSGPYFAFASQQNVATDNLAFSIDTIELAPLAAATTLASSANPATFGDSVTFTATVSSNVGTPTGVVTFRDGATPLGTGTLNGFGVATLTTANLGAGSHSMTASYGGDANNGSSLSPELIQIMQTPLETWLAAVFTSAQLNDPTVSGLTADFDRDGLTTLMEYALDAEPLTASIAELPLTDWDAQGRLTLTFFRARADLTYEVEGSGDLITWSVIPVVAGAVGQNEVVIDNAPPTATPRFLRLRVTR